jgi:xanthine dehydrogenase YagS FAD-binding subunit
MKAFEYASPATVEEAVQLLSADASAALAGGTDLINRMKDGVTSPGRVVYVRPIEALGVCEAGDSLVLGAATTLAAIAAHPAIAERYPALRQATLEVGTPQIRNMATLGGNLLQRPRDWYFRNGFGLLGGPNQAGHAVRDGDNRYASIFLTDGEALYAFSSSLAVPLIALEATATLVGPDGERTVPVQALYKVPKDDQDTELDLRPGELLTAVTVPPCQGKNASYEVRWKQSHDWPLALASVCCVLDGDRVTAARIVLGQVAPIPYRSEDAERAIVGKPINEETATAAGEAAVAQARPLSMNAYKVPITRTAVKRVLLTVAGNRYWEEA